MKSDVAERSVLLRSLPDHSSSQSADWRAARLQHHFGLHGGSVAKAYQLLGQRERYLSI